MSITSRPFGNCIIAIAFIISIAGCESTPATPTPPPPYQPFGGALVTFLVGDEPFRVFLTRESQLEAARAAHNNGTRRIPIGRIVWGRDVNFNWSWHLVDLEFAEAAAAGCDGRPSDVERAGVPFGGGWFCPWSAEVVAITEFQTMTNGGNGFPAASQTSSSSRVPHPAQTRSLGHYHPW